MTRVFKVRYYPDYHILNARKGNGDSFIWAGIWEAKETLSIGFRWVLGDGQEINIFSDTWLRGKNDF